MDKYDVCCKCDLPADKMVYQQTGDVGDVSDETSDEGVQVPRTCIVIKVARHVRDVTVQWLVNKIRGKRRDGGAELVVRQEPYDPSEVRLNHAYFIKQFTVTRALM